MGPPSRAHQPSLMAAMSPRIQAPSLALARATSLPWPRTSLRSCLLCCLLISLPPQDPSSPHSVHSYSSRENGVEKVPLGRKEAVPLSPTSMASSSSASPSRSKDAPTVRALRGAAGVLRSGVVLGVPAAWVRLAELLDMGPPASKPMGRRQCWGDREGSCSIRSPLVSHPADLAALAGLGCCQG